jgi:hypothetical protein
MMVNYLYDSDLKILQDRAEKFDDSGAIHKGDCITDITK